MTKSPSKLQQYFAIPEAAKYWQFVQGSATFPSQKYLVHIAWGAAKYLEVMLLIIRRKLRSENAVIVSA
jgi:hypothetical protein